MMNMVIQHNKAQIIIPDAHPNPPEDHERLVASILASFFNCTVEFLIPIDDYKRKTPDIVMNGIIFEIKSPTGNSRHTVRNQFDRASSQHASGLILDGQRTKLDDATLKKQIMRELAMRHRIKRVIFITKSQKILEFRK